MDHQIADVRLSRRAEVIRGYPNWQELVHKEAGGEYIRRVQEEAQPRGNMLITGKFLMNIHDQCLI